MIDIASTKPLEEELCERKMLPSSRRQSILLPKDHKVYHEILSCKISSSKSGGYNQRKSTKVLNSACQEMAQQSNARMLYISGRHTHTITSLPCISVSVRNTKFARGVLKRDVSLLCTEILCRSNKKAIRS